MLLNHWIPLSKIENWIDLEPLLVGAVLSALAWVFYRFFLKAISTKRHENLRVRFKSLFSLYFLFLLMSLVYWGYHGLMSEHTQMQKAFAYWALVSVYVEAFFLIRLAQVALYLYLFFSHLSVGVPRLIANSFTLIFATFILAWLTSEVFGFNVTHLLATSAIFSVVLGLALQDTLGNFFSGIAMQMDRPFGIGDWVEIHSGQQKWMGQIQEVNWRATLLLGFGDELISIPNKTMAQSQVLILSHAGGTARCSQTFRLAHETDLARVKETLLKVFQSHPGVMENPPVRPLVLAVEESWVVLKLFYTVKEFGLKYRVGDQLLQQSIQQLQAEKLKLAHTIVDIQNAE